MRRRTCRPRARGLTALSLLLAVLSGCQAPQHRARQQARQRWRLARAEVTARLANELWRAGQLDDALEELNKARSLNPDDPALALLEARIQLARGDVPAAHAALARAPSDGPLAAEALYLRGVLAQQQGRWQCAARLYEAALHQRPNDVATLVALVQARLQQGRAAEALELLDRAAGVVGQTAAYAAARAEVLEQLGRWQAAAEAWRQVVMRSGADDARGRLALALFCAGDYGQARRVLDELIEAPPPTLPALWLKVLRARCLLYEGQVSAAARALESLVRDDPRQVAAIVALAEVRLAQKRLDQARALADEAGRLAPDDPRVLELRAALSWAAGDGTEARTLAAELSRLPGGSPVAAEILSRLAESD